MYQQKLQTEISKKESLEMGRKQQGSQAKLFKKEFLPGETAAGLGVLKESDFVQRMQTNDNWKQVEEYPQYLQQSSIPSLEEMVNNFISKDKSESTQEDEIDSIRPVGAYSNLGDAQVGAQNPTPVALVDVIKIDLDSTPLKNVKDQHAAVSKIYVRDGMKALKAPYYKQYLDDSIKLPKIK